MTIEAPNPYGQTPDVSVLLKQNPNPVFGIIGAMEEEVICLRDQLENRVDHNIANFEFHEGTLAGAQVVLLKSGIGKVNAAIGTTLLLERFTPDCVINTGSAGGFNADLSIGDVVISDAVTQHDFDLTVFGYEHGQVPQMPPRFIPDAKLLEIAETSIHKVHDVKTVKGLIASGDAFMADPAKVEAARTKFPDMMAVEMEAGAIAQTCFRFAVPFIIFRALSDIAGKEANVSFQEFLEQAGVHSAHMVTEMVRELAQYAASLRG